MQLRDDMTHAFAMTFKDRPLELGELAFGLIRRTGTDGKCWIMQNTTLLFSAN